jgi:hypothetical protein
MLRAHPIPSRRPLHDPSLDASVTRSRDVRVPRPDLREMSLPEVT